MYATPCVAPSLPSSPAQRRGEAEQQSQRNDEQVARRHAAEMGRHWFDRGWLWTEIADLIHVAGRTLRHWCHELLDFFRPAVPLGRPRRRSSREARNEVIHVLDEFGPGLGVPSLRPYFPTMNRAELEELVHRYRRVWRERNRVPLRVLHWPVAGRVWAIDYAEPPSPIEGRFDALLAVRDLSSGMQLLWQPVAAATGANAARSLQSLFAVHGPPLVVKSDNGGHFTCPLVQDLLRAQRVACLLSPPYWPRYNGGIEAAIGSLKERTEAHAARAGHAGAWTWDDTAGALREANARPPGPSPAGTWALRLAIDPRERERFAATVVRQQAAVESRQSTCDGGESGVMSQRGLAREAIRRALEECGYLHYTRRRLLPPIPRPKAARIM